MKIKFISSIDILRDNITVYQDSYDKVFIITQQNIVDTYFLNKIISTKNCYICNDGEDCKSIEEYQNLIQYLSLHQCNRTSLLIAIGGGAVTDLCGFVASTYMRGISYINVPTTLLGMVDASIGGKTAINFEGKRNLIGTFNNPNSIIIFNKFLHSLSSNELINGYAEIIKYGLIMDKTLFKKIEQNIETLLSGLDLKLINEIIQTCINHKLKIVKQDQYDQGIRNILNFGHTVGHALESYYKFQLSHGKAVLHGIKVASYLSYQKQHITEIDYMRIIRLIDKIKIKSLQNLDINKVLDYIDNDKKHIGNQLNYILLKRIGSAYIEKNYNKQNLINGLKIL